MMDRQMWKAVVDVMDKMARGEAVALDLRKLRLQVSRIPSPLERMADRAATDYALHDAVRLVDGAALEMAKGMAVEAYPYFTGQEEDPEGRDWDNQFRLAAYVFADLMQISGLYEIAASYAPLAEQQLSSARGRALVVEKETELASDFGLTAEEIEGLVDGFTLVKIRPLSLPHNELKKLLAVMGSAGGAAGAVASGISNLSSAKKSADEEDWLGLALSLLSMLICIIGLIL